MIIKIKFVFKAYEVTKQLESSLEDITAVCILEAFQNPSSLQMADRILKELGFLIYYYWIIFQIVWIKLFFT